MRQQRECSFRPALNTHSMQITRNRYAAAGDAGAGGAGSVHDRQEQQRRVKQQKLARKREEERQKEVAECKFHPKRVAGRASDRYLQSKRRLAESAAYGVQDGDPNPSRKRPLDMYAQIQEQQQLQQQARLHGYEKGHPGSRACRLSERR